jgi:hypothetical protein
MKRIGILSRNGQKIEIEFPPSHLTQNFYVIGLHKAGSVLLNNCVRSICRFGRAPVISIEEALFTNGTMITDIEPSEFQKLDHNGYVYAGFRAPSILEHMRSYRSSPKLILVRDIRDVAVSYYFSLLYSHPKPGEGTALCYFNNLRSSMSSDSVSSAILSGKMDMIFNFAATFCSHINLLENFKIYRYEDVIFEKQRWVSELASFLQIDASSENVLDIVNKFDYVPEKEDIYQHVRQVRPGNYKAHLTRRAIDYIQDRYLVFFEKFGYSLDILNNTSVESLTSLTHLLHLRGLRAIKASKFRAS